jgi:hypothetical protein
MTDRRRKLPQPRNDIGDQDPSRHQRHPLHNPSGERMMAHQRTPPPPMVREIIEAMIEYAGALERAGAIELDWPACFKGMTSQPLGGAYAFVLRSTDTILKFTRIRSFVRPEGEPPWIVVDDPELFGLDGRIGGGGATMAVWAADIAMALELIPTDEEQPMAGAR